MSAIVLVTPTPEFEDRVRAALDVPPDAIVRQWREEYLRIDPSKVVDLAHQTGARVVCLGPGLALDTLIDLAAAFDREHPEQCVVAVATPSAELWEGALHAGVRDVLGPDAADDALRATLRRALATAERRLANLLPSMEPERPGGRVISVVSPKGGSGKTTVATNLAVALASAMPGDVALVDLDLMFGDVAAALQLVPEHTLADVARSPVPVDATMLKVFLTPHRSNLYALCCPETPAESEEVSHEHTSAAVRLLGAELGVVVLDTPAGLDGHTLSAIEQSSDLVLVCTTDVAGVRSMRKELDALDRLGMTEQQRLLVLNRADARVGVDPRDVEAILGMRADVTVPSSRAVPLSMNEGTPLVESDPRSPVSRALRSLAERFADPTTTTIPNPPGRSAPGLLARLREGR
jgi:pilus assembly protein CpaE